MTQCCKTCAWLAVTLDKRNRRIVLDSRTYPCTAPIPEMPLLPDSITNSFTYKPVTERMRNHVAGSGGVTCPVWKALPEK